jgi:hypothetical protein
VKGGGGSVRWALFARFDSKEGLDGGTW